MKYLTLIATLMLTSTALAGRDFGVVLNWPQYAGKIEQNALVTALQPNDPTGALARGLISGGRFQVTFDDNAALRQAQNAPNCGTARSTPGLRVTLLTGLMIQGNQGIYKLSREYKTQGRTVTDVYIFANKDGTVNGKCSENENFAQYNLSLKSGWNVARLSSDIKGSNMILTNLNSKPIPWNITK